MTRLRVPVHTTASRDPRFSRLGKLIGQTKWDAFGRAQAVWMLCNERHADEVGLDDADAIAELEGFGRAMIAADLAELLTETSIYVRGMSERAAFLQSQVEKGRRSGEARRRDPIARRITTLAQTSLELQDRTYVPGVVEPDEEHMFEGRVDHKRASNGEAEHHRTSVVSENEPNRKVPRNLQDLDLRSLRGSGSEISGLSGSNGPDLDIQLSGSKRTSEVETADSRRSARGVDPTEPMGEASIVALRANGEDVDSIVGRPKSAIEPPQEALVAAHLLIDYICANSPACKVARLSDASRNALGLRWADELRRMNVIDRIPWPSISMMIHWSQRHTFWRSNVLSAAALRRSWDQMVAQRSRPRGDAPQRKGTLEHAREAIERLDAEDDARERVAANDGVPSTDPAKEHAS